MNTEILKTHFSSLFNSQVKIDFSAIDKIPNHETQHKLGEMPSQTKIMKSICKMANNKAPGKLALLLI
jgi:hypothetical protein